MYLAADLPEFLARLDLVVETDDCVTIVDFKSSRGAWSQDQVRDAGEQLLLYHQLAGPLAGGTATSPTPSTPDKARDRGRLDN